MTENTDNILNAIPAKLKDARKARGLSLEAIAKLSGVSRSMVSQIERGESSPTIATLWNLTRALNVDFAGLMEQHDVGDKINVLRASEVPSIKNMGKGCRISILSPPEKAGKHEIYDLEFDDKGHLKSQPHSQGATEQLTVLEGSVRVTSGSATMELFTGDTASYAGDVYHEISALNGKSRVFLIVESL